MLDPCKDTIMLNEMIMRLADQIESLLPEGRDDLARRAKDLSLSYTSERDGSYDDYFSDEEKVAAYVAAFLLPNAVKVLHCLEQMDGMGLIPNSKTIDILDIGTGPGTTILATSVFFAKRYPGRAVRFAGIERSRPVLVKAHELFKLIAPPDHSFESVTKEVDAKSLGSFLKNHRFDIVTAANVINEFDDDEALNLCRNILEYHVGEGGSLVIIDPALRQTTKPLMGMRNRLLDEGIASIAAPCLHQKFCPMLEANERDWCHFYIDWERPEFLKELDERAGMDRTHLKMAYFILQKSGMAVSRHRSHACPERSRRVTRLWRVVSSPLVSKGKRELMLCGENGELMRARRLDRDASDENTDFDAVKRGDIVSCADGYRIGKDDAFSIVERWQPGINGASS